MRRLYCLFLDRSDPKQGLKTILTAIDYIKRGISICIFPEGTRNTGAELSLLPFKDGAFKIATKTGCPIVPICMNNTAEIFENHFPKIRKTHVVIEYQKPIYPDRLDKETKRHIGESMVEKLILNDKKTGKDFELHVSGVFVAVGQIPKNETFADTVKLDEGGFVLASEDCLTSHPGIFAAGDCRTKEVRQLTTAAADGAVAALAACKYIGDHVESIIKETIEKNAKLYF